MASKAIGFLNFKFGADLGGFERAMNKAQKKLKKFGKSVEKTGKTLTTSLTLPILGLAGASLKLASDFEETDTKFQQVFESIRGEANRTAETFSKSFGLSRLASKQLLSDTGDLLVGFGFTEDAALGLSDKVNKLAVDLASFTNFEGGAEGASKALTKALVGETESAKALGIVIRQGTKEYKDRTQEIMREQNVSILQAKALNNLEIAYSQSQKAIGDFERTQSGFANQVRIVRGDLIDLSVSIGEKLLPIAQKTLSFFKGLIVKLDSLSSAQKESIVKWGLIIAAIGPVLIIVGKLSIGLAALLPILTAIGLTNPFTLILLGATAAIALITKITIALNKQFNAKQKLNEVNEIARKTIQEDLLKIKVSTSLLNDENTTLSHKKKLLNELKEAYPGYYDQLDEATISTKTLEQANDNLINSLLKGAQVEALKDRLVEIQKEIIEAQGEMGTSFLEDFGVTGGGTPIDMMLKTLTLKTGIKDIENLNKEAEILANTLEKLMVNSQKTDENFTKINHTTKEFSNSTEKLGNTFEKFQSPIQETALVWDTLAHSMSNAEDQFEGIVFWQTELTDNQKLLNAGIGMFGDVLTSSLDSALNSQENFFDVFIKNIKKAITSLLIQLAVMSLINMMMGGGAAAFSISSLKTNLGSLMGVTSGVTPFAEGGLVTGPTTALIGEGVGTNAGNPEVVAPLDKLKSMMGGNNSNITVTGKLIGSDIFLSNQNASNNRLRTT